MFRINTEGSVNGLFSSGNPQAGQAATIISDAWLNEIQETLIHVIETAGISLDEGNHEQLTDAILELISGVVGTGDGGVPTTRRVNTSGLLSGGGALAADLNIGLTAATGEQQIAGTANDVVSTPLSIAQAFSGTTNILRLPGGWIIQIGRIVGSFSEGSILATLPTSFTSTNYNLALTSINQSGNNANDVFMQLVNKGTSNFTAYFNFDGDGSNSINGFEYIAIGR